MAERDIELWKLALEGLKAVALVAGAGWALWRFRRERTDAPQIAFTIDAKMHGPSKGRYVAEYILTFENKGKTRVEVSEIILLVRGIKMDENIEQWEGKEPRLHFPHKLVDNRKIIPEKFGYTFFEPSIRQEYVYVSSVQDDFKFLLLHGLFNYKNGDTHSTERIVELKRAPSYSANAVASLGDVV